MVLEEQAALVPAEVAMDTTQYKMMVHQAKALVGTGFLPDAIRTPEQALAIMMKGRELGIPPMYALSNIVVIKGKPTANAELMLALIYRDHGDEALRIAESDEKICVALYKRRGWHGPERFAFTMEDAQRANLLTNDTWKKYPKAMLRARCISAVARMAFPDTLGGLYTPEELGAAVAVDAEGTQRVIDAQTTPAPTPGFSAPAQAWVEDAIADDLDEPVQ